MMKILELGRKLIFPIIALIVVIGVFFFVKKKLSSSQAVLLPGGLNTDINKVLNGGKSRQLTDVDRGSYLALADQLATAMDGLGTDITAMDRIFARVHADNAFAALYQAFGQRRYLIDGDGTLFGFIPVGSLIDLNNWLGRELSGNDLNKWRKALNDAGY